MQKVWEKSFGYSFFRPYIDWAVRNTYSRITTRGLENIPDPKDVSVMIAFNHCNTLMDALLVLQTRKGPTAFVARADIFKNPHIAKILGNLRILPIYRQRDGIESHAKNFAVFDNVVECLEHGVTFAISPEGTHRPRRSLLPIKKGIFHISEQAVAQKPERKLVIVPVGLDYEDYFNIMCPVTITFGEPIEIKGGEDYDEMAAELGERMSKLITWFPDDENLAANEKALEEARKPHYNILHYILAVISLPFFLISGFLCSPMILLSALFTKRIKDRAWHNTVRYVCKLFLTPFTVAGAAIAGFANLPWHMALLLTAATLVAHPVFYRILIFYKRLLSK